MPVNAVHGRLKLTMADYLPPRPPPSGPALPLASPPCPCFPPSPPRQGLPANIDDIVQQHEGSSDLDAMSRVATPDSTVHIAIVPAPGPTPPPQPTPPLASKGVGVESSVSATASSVTSEPAATDTSSITRLGSTSSAPGSSDDAARRASDGSDAGTLAGHQPDDADQEATAQLASPEAEAELDVEASPTRPAEPEAETELETELEAELAPVAEPVDDEDQAHDLDGGAAPTIDVADDDDSVAGTEPLAPPSESGASRGRPPAEFALSVAAGSASGDLLFRTSSGQLLHAESPSSQSSSFPAIAAGAGASPLASPQSKFAGRLGVESGGVRPRVHAVYRELALSSLEQADAAYVAKTWRACTGGEPGRPLSCALTRVMLFACDRMGPAGGPRSVRAFALLLQRDAYLVFRALCRLTMRPTPYVPCHSMAVRERLPARILAYHGSLPCLRVSARVTPEYRYPVCWAREAPRCLFGPKFCRCSCCCICCSTRGVCSRRATCL